MSDFPALSREVEWEIKQDFEDSTIVSPYEDGYQHTRPRFTKDRKKWSNIIYKHLNVTDKNTLEDFIDEVRGKAVAFNWVNPDDGVNYVVRFDPQPSITYMATGHYYQAEMGFAEVGGPQMVVTARETSYPMVASEDIPVGSFINIFSNAGAAQIRKADSVLGREANGFILSNVSSGDTTIVYFAGRINNALSGLTPASVYYLSTDGTITLTAPTDGSTIQRIGGALSASELLFQPGDPI